MIIYKFNDDNGNERSIIIQDKKKVNIIQNGNR